MPPKPPEIPTRSWEEMKSQIYWSLEPATGEMGDAIFDQVTARTRCVLVVCEPDEGTVTWLTPGLLEKWNVSPETVRAAAARNLDLLLEDRQPEVDEVLGMKLGMVPVASIFKASLVLAPSFKAFVEEKLGWPVLAVVPCRDFIYVLPEKDRELLHRMGGVVQREFRESGNPITTEVLRLSDDGIEAIGAFPP